MLKTSILSILFSFSLLMQGCNNNEKVIKKDTIIKTTPKNEFILTTLDNKHLTVQKKQNGFMIKELKNKIIIFDIFATWCPPCQKAASHLSSLQKKYKDDLVVIGLTIEENIPNINLEIFKKQHNANYTFVNSKINRSFIYKIAEELELGNRFPIPIVVIYKDGKYINHYIGSVEEEFIETDIKNTLGKK